MLLREENGCCSRRQSSSSAGDSDGEREDSPAARARQQLEALLNKTMRIRMTDGRTLVGCFLCTDRDCNVILGSAQEFLKPSGQCPRTSSRDCGGVPRCSGAGPALAYLPDALTSSLQIPSPRGSPASWAWPWYPATTSSLLKCRGRAWRGLPISEHDRACFAHH